MLAHRLQHRQHRQVGLAGGRLVDIRVRAQDGDDIMGEGVDGVLVDLGHPHHRIGERIVVGERVDVRQQTFDGGQLQVLHQRLGGGVWRRREHQRLGAEPPRRDTLRRHAQRVQGAPPQHHRARLARRPGLVQQVGLFDQFALAGGLFRLVFDHAPSGCLRLFGELPLQRGQGFARTQYLHRAACMPPSACVARRGELLLDGERHPQVGGQLLP